MTFGEIGAAEGDEGHAGFEQSSDPLVVMNRAGEDEAVDCAPPDRLPIGLGLALAPMGGEEMDVHARVGGPLGDLMEEGVEGESIPAGRDAVADGEGAPLGQRPSGAVGAIAKPIRRLDDLEPGLLGDPIGRVECVGDSGDGHPGRPTHVLDRDSRLMCRKQAKTFYERLKRFLQVRDRSVNGETRGDG